MKVVIQSTAPKHLSVFLCFDKQLSLLHVLLLDRQCGGSDNIESLGVERQESSKEQNDPLVITRGFSLRA
jgi:hypothetical protein